MEVGTIYRTDGSTRRVLPANNKEFSLTELQNVVGGLIELVCLAPGYGDSIMYCNEEGKLHRLPYNEGATALLDHDNDDFIAGDTIVIRHAKLCC